MEKTGRKQYDVDLTATNPLECPGECLESVTLTGHFSRKNGTGSWFANLTDNCGGGTVDLGPWIAQKQACP